MSAPAPPCHGCPRRRPGCHDGAVCPPWAAYQAAMADYQRGRAAAKERERMLAEYDKSVALRARARRGSHERG